MYDRLIPSAASSARVPYSPLSSMPYQQCARASALPSVPSCCGSEIGTISLPSGATLRLQLPRRWKRMGMRTTRVCPSNGMPSPIGVHR